MNKPVPGVSALLVSLFVSTASWGETYFTYLPEGGAGADGAVFTGGSASFSFTAAPFLKVEGFGGLSVSDTGVRSATQETAFVFDAIGDGQPGQINYQAEQYQVSGTLQSLSVATDGISFTDFRVYAPLIHVAGGVRIELASGDLSTEAIKGRPGTGGVANVQGGFVEITNIEISGGYVHGTVSGANGLTAHDNVALWRAGSDWCNDYSCLPTRGVSGDGTLDLMSWSEKAGSPNQKLEITANDLIRQGLAMSGMADIDIAHPYQMNVVNALTLTGAETSAQFQSPIGYLHGPLPIPVPEPGSLPLIGLGLIGVAAGVRRQAKRA